MLFRQRDTLLTAITKLGNLWLTKIHLLETRDQTAEPRMFA